MPLGDSRDDRESEPAALAPRLLASVKTVEHAFEFRLRNPRAAIDDLEADPLARASQHHIDATTRRRMTNRIVDQVS